jgi:diguanylate cyclase (GGDEF)-like protein
MRPSLVALAPAAVVTALASAAFGWLAFAVCGLALAAFGLGAWWSRLQMRTEVDALVAGTLAVGLAPREQGTDAGALSTNALLQPLADGLHTLQWRQQRLFAEQAAQLDQLRLQVHTDALTGLPNRRLFLARLDAVLAGSGGPAGAGLLLLRLKDLQGLNQRIGHNSADHVLQALAQALQAYTDRIDPCFAGRLNGADFALLLPVGGLATETATALLRALRQPLAHIDASASVSAGAVELRAGLSAAQALALADAALAQAEVQGGLRADAVAVVDAQGLAGLAPAGESSWQRRIARALAQGRASLGSYEVRAADGRQLHLDCPLRLQLTPDGPMEPAARWLSLATRSRLCPDVDERAIALALQATTADGVARCVNVSGVSLASAEFVAAVSRRLEAHPDAAARLWIDIAEAVALERPMLVREVSRRWRPLGVMMGLEHAGEGLARIPRLMDLGLDCVRIDGRFVNSIAGDAQADARRYLQGLVRLVQAVGLQVMAEGVRSPDDLALLWDLGFDAATGPALSHEPAALSEADDFVESA